MDIRQEFAIVFHKYRN